MGREYTHDKYQCPNCNYVYEVKWLLDQFERGYKVTPKSWYSGEFLCHLCLYKRTKGLIDKDIKIPLLIGIK